MTRARLASALATIVALGGAWLVWDAAPPLTGMLGLGRFDPLVRVLLVFAALSLGERAVAYLSTRFSPSQVGSSQETPNDH